MKFLWPWRKDRRDSAFPPSEEEAEHRRDRTALMFLLDRSYLIGLQTLLFTLRNSYDTAHTSIVVMTNDLKVRDDPFVRNVADQILYVDSDHIRRFSHLRKKKEVKRHLRHPDVGRYTFLKFLGYADLGYRGRIFMDTDLISLSEELRLSEMCGDWDFAAARSLGGQALGIEGKDLEHREFEPAERLRILEKTRSVARTAWGPEHMFNAGVTYASRAILGDSTVESLMSLARRETLRGEQPVVWNHIASTIDPARYKSLPITYNFCQLPALAMGEEHFRAFQPRIRLLHYNRKKPWLNARDEQTWLDRLWFQARESAESWIAERS